MDPIDALKLMVSQYPGGSDCMALRVGKPAETLRKELSADPKFKLGLRTALLISDLCIEAKSEHCMAFVNASAAAAGGFVQLPVGDASEPANIHRSMSVVIREMSDVSVVTIDGDADGVISDNDLERALREIEEARAALQLHEQSLRRKNAAGKPQAAHLRGVQ